MRTVNEDEMIQSTAGLRRELDVGQLGGALARHRRWIILPALLCCVAAAIGVNLVTPRYTAEAKILLENQENFFNRPDRSDVVSQAPLPDDEAVQSQVQLVTSRDIARRALKDLDVAGNPEFDPAAGGLGSLNRLLVLLGLERDPLRAGAEDRLLQAYYDRLTVYPIVKSRVLSVQFTATDSDLAAKAANTVSTLYIDLQSDAKRESAKAAATSLANLIADLKVKVAAADTKAQDYRARNGLLVGTNNTTITSQQLSDITTQLAQARTGEADSEAKAKLLRDMIRQNRITDVPDVANSDLIRRISEQRIALKAQIAQQAITLLPGHPRMREMNAQLADLDGQLRVAADKVVRQLENDARISASRIDNLRATLDAQKQTATLASTDQVALNELEQQARLLKDQLDFSTQKYQEALARENAVSTPADARIISRAVAPELPSFPKKLPIIAIFSLAGLLLSIGMIVGRELLSGRAFVADEERRLAAPPMPAAPASLPSAVEVTADRETRAGELRPTHEPRDVASDASEEEQEPEWAAMLDMVADHTKDGGGVRLLVMRSADAALIAPEGALALARGLARRSRVILVDCGFDEQLDRLLAAPRTTDDPPVRGLRDLLAGDTSFAEVIHRDPLTRLHVVPYGAGEGDADGDGFGILIDALVETYDHVVMAVPTPTDDTAIRGAAQGDIAILFVTEETDQHVIDSHRTRLHEAGVPSVYVLDVAELAAAPLGDRRSAAA